MQFNSLTFIFLFLPITIVAYFSLIKFQFFRLAKGSIVIASLVFYAYNNILIVPVLLASIVFNFIFGSNIEKQQSPDVKKILLSIAIVGNIFFLGFFKYTDFFITTLNDFARTSFLLPNIILPLGISFFTFTQCGYLIDTYRGETGKISLLDYSFFVCFFPYLISGPIPTYKEIVPDISRLKSFSQQHLVVGIIIFLIGLSKKMLIADNLAAWVQPVFDANHGTDLTIIETWVGVISYSMQLYFDFSGYSEMALGIGIMFNFKLPVNFNTPYKSLSIIEFWRRWHITLSRFLQKYLYIPLGGNRRGKLTQMRNLLIIMLIGGLWHGAGWTFILWGGLHGVYLIVNHSWRKLNIEINKFASWLLTYLSVVVAWVFFRAATVKNALHIIATMFGANGIVLKYGSHKLAFLRKLGIVFAQTTNFFLPYQIILLLILVIIVLIEPNILELLSCKDRDGYININPVIAFAAGLLGFVLVQRLIQAPPSQFMYFRF